MATLASNPDLLPFDVRLMNGVASLLYGLAGAGLLAGGVLFFVSVPVHIVIRRRLARSSARELKKT